MRNQRGVKYLTRYAAYILVIWGFYRVLFKLPDNIEELILKPIIWLVPVFFILKKEKLGFSSLGITLKNLFPAIYFSIGLGLVFAVEAVILNFVKYGSFNFGAYIGPATFIPSLGITLATAISEEISFRGYIFNRLTGILKSEWTANLTTSFVWALVHIPVTVFVWRLDVFSAAIYLFLTTLFGIGSAFIFARTKNIASSILLHVLWSWPIILFR